jgi:hypothetical protein
MEKYPSKHGLKYPIGKMQATQMPSAKCSTKAPSIKPTYHMPTGVSPAQMPMGVSPTQMAPQAVSPQAMTPGLAPGAMMGPTNIAPLRRIVHPTQQQVRQRTTRYPVENVYPTHTHHVHNHICEYTSCYPHTESYQDCYYSVSMPPRPMRRRPF